MEADPQRFFEPIEPPRSLVPAIFTRIERSSRRRARLTFAGLAAAAGASAAVLAAAASYANQELYASGFYDYAALLATDSAARAHWQEVVASLAAGLPSIAILAMLGCIAVLWWSITGMRYRAVRFANSFA